MIWHVLIIDMVSSPFYRPHRSLLWPFQAHSKEKMAEILVSTSTGAMNSLLIKLGILLSDKYKLLKHVHEDIRFLIEELEAMQAFLRRMADVEELDEQGRLRVRVVRELSYDIEDHVDKFMVGVHRDSSSMSIHGFMKLIEKTKRWINDIKVRHQIVKEVKTIKIQVKEASERYARYKIDGSPSVPRNAEIDPRVLAVFKDASELVGIEGPRDELVKWLKEDREDESAHLRRTVSIVGLGGAGKTTLANQVYQKVGANFNCGAFVSVSRKPDLANVLCSLLSQICKQEDFNTRAGDQLLIINKIREFLKDKRYGNVDAVVMASLEISRHFSLKKYHAIFSADVPCLLD